MLPSTHSRIRYVSDHGCNLSQLLPVIKPAAPCRSRSQPPKSKLRLSSSQSLKGREGSPMGGVPWNRPSPPGRWKTALTSSRAIPSPDLSTRRKRLKRSGRGCKGLKSRNKRKRKKRESVRYIHPIPSEYTFLLTQAFLCTDGGRSYEAASDELSFGIFNTCKIPAQS